MSPFVVGMKVVCVDDGDSPPYSVPQATPLKRGEVYTIRTVGPFRFMGANGLPDVALAVRLVGIKRPGINGVGADLPFGAQRFRPVEPKCAQLFRDIAAGVSNNKPIIDDPQREAEPEIIWGEMITFSHGRPML